MEGDNPIGDYVFPLLKGRIFDNKLTQVELIGTGFLIGRLGYAITAGHVIDQLLEDNEPNDHILAGFLEDNKWTVLTISHYEKHESEDVGIIKINNLKRNSILRITDAPYVSSAQYICWGYPHEVAKELLNLSENALLRPDLIYTQGYVRRRIDGELYPTIIFKGTQFYELSETVGGGNSGGPIIDKNSLSNDIWTVFGIYIGEKSEGNISYAVRTEAFSSWAPQLLGHTIIEECNNFA